MANDYHRDFLRLLEARGRGTTPTAAVAVGDAPDRGVVLGGGR
jgi:hypothetical protein